jgi:hypothetical protein
MASGSQGPNRLPEKGWEQRTLGDAHTEAPPLRCRLSSTRPRPNRRSNGSCLTEEQGTDPVAASRAARTRGAGRRRAEPLITIRRFGNRSPIHALGVVMVGRRGSAARARRRRRCTAEQGRGWFSDAVVMRLVVATAMAVTASRFDVGWGSWSRMRHQRATAGWSSDSSAAAAADRTSRAVKPAVVRFVNLSATPAAMGPRWRSGPVQRAGCCDRLLHGSRRRQVACRVAVARLGRGGRVGVARWIAGRSCRLLGAHTCLSAISSAGTPTYRRAAQAGVSAAALTRTGLSVVADAIAVFGRDLPQVVPQAATYGAAKSDCVKWKTCARMAQRYSSRA